MKIYTASVCLIIAIISFGCINTNPKIADKISATKDSISAFSPVIDKAIRECLDYVAEIGIDTVSSKTLINLIFTNSEENRYLIVYMQPFYDKRNVKGYMNWQNYTVAYYGGRNACADAFIDREKLMVFTDSIPGFTDITEYPLDYYDPYGIKFKIINNDSLKIIHKGML
ncbi:hypothetical protein [Alistipes sp.]|uniref:hypothetical protein n=1 Tax=Alistipes sp. TaxID=1872444 RepID=UPI003AB817C1